jgi:hypothetical protein
MISEPRASWGRAFMLRCSSVAERLAAHPGGAPSAFAAALEPLPAGTARGAVAGETLAHARDVAVAARLVAGAARRAAATADDGQAICAHRAGEAGTVAAGLTGPTAVGVHAHAHFAARSAVAAPAAARAADLAAELAGAAEAGEGAAVAADPAAGFALAATREAVASLAHFVARAGGTARTRGADTRAADAHRAPRTGRGAGGHVGARHGHIEQHGRVGRGSVEPLRGCIEPHRAVHGAEPRGIGLNDRAACRDQRRSEQARQADRREAPHPARIPGRG